MTNKVPITPVEAWIKARTGAVDADSLLSEQLVRVRAVIDYAKAHSPFYREHLSGVESSAIRSREDMAKLPFTDADMLRENPLPWLCVGQQEISRIVTLESSGTEGAPKRVYFTEEDQELTMDFFAHGMMTLIEPPALVMILMPGARPGSIGDLLAKALERKGVDSVIHGPIAMLEDAYEVLRQTKANCLVGIPNQVLALARYGELYGNPERDEIRSVLLSADYVPKAISEEIERLWQCPVFGHYGMTETGLGGGVECAVLDGYHMREGDLLVEIIDPKSGAIVPDGEAGEVVFTTLTRKGMPFIRYRTGDISRWLTKPCPCGTWLRRLDRVSGRISGSVSLKGEEKLSQSLLDEVIFKVKDVMDFQTFLSEGKVLIKLRGIKQPDFTVIQREVRGLLPAKAGEWQIELEWEPLEVFTNRGTLKRKITDLRQEKTDLGREQE